MRVLSLALFFTGLLVLLLFLPLSLQRTEIPTVSFAQAMYAAPPQQMQRAISETFYLAVVNFSSRAYTVTESAQNVVITVTLDTTTTVPLIVGYHTADGTATRGQDYINTRGLLTFTPGITQQTFSVPVLADAACELDETIYLNLGNAPDASFTLGMYRSAALRILNDDPCYAHLPLTYKNYTPPALTDRLLNPGFEGGSTHDTIYGEDSTIMTPESWITWWEENPDLNMQRPETRVIPNKWPYNSDPIRIYSGEQALQIFRGWSVYRAGFLQHVDDLPIGATAVFSTYAHAWACQNDPPPALSCNGPNAYHFKVGIDPTGGIDPLSTEIIWSDKAFIYDVYDVVGPVTATVGMDRAITVYLYAEPNWPLKFVDGYFDEAHLIVYP